MLQIPDSMLSNTYPPQPIRGSGKTMKNDQRVFLSYAQADKSEVAQIANDLKQQGFEVWEYAQQWKRSDVGHPLPEEFSELMHRSTYFVPVVSASSVSPSNGKYAVMELDYALELDMIAQKRVFPIVLSGSRPKKWLKPYDTLESLSAVEVNIPDTRSYLKAMAQLCRNLKVSYKPYFEEHPLLPFWKGFSDEIDELRQTNDNSWKLMPVIAEFNGCFVKRNWDNALELISYFLSAACYEWPTQRFFYSWIVKSICEIEAGNLTQAEESIRAASEEKSDDPIVFGAFGYLSMRRRDLTSTREFLTKALSRCGPSDNLYGRFHYLYPLIEIGEMPDRSDRKLIFDADISLWPQDSLRKLCNAREILRFRCKEYRKGLDVFEEMRRREIHDTTSIIYAHLCLKELGEHAEAEALLTSAIRECQTNSKLSVSDLYYQLAEFDLFLNEPRKAVTIYEKHLLGPEVKTRQLAVRFARILRKMGDEKRMRIECGKMINGMFPTPQTCEDFYYDGFANYLLGNAERAQYDYERSRRFGPHYSQE
jgi:tetratricopeptide (TPR) repeat protein